MKGNHLSEALILRFRSENRITASVQSQINGGIKNGNITKGQYDKDGLPQMVALLAGWTNGFLPKQNGGGDKQEAQSGGKETIKPLWVIKGGGGKGFEGG